MDVVQARQMLGVAPSDDWLAVRAAYKVQIRTAHPDAGGPAGRAAEINAAYTFLARTRRAGQSIEAPPAVAARSRVSVRPSVRLADDVELADGDTLVLRTPPDETFARLLVALDRLGEVTFVDRSCPIIEAIVVLDDGTSHSLVLTLQGRGERTEVFATLEALATVASGSPAPVLRQLAVFLPPR